MKRLLLITALAILGLSSCKKEETKKAPTVEYEVSCTSCKVQYTNEYGFIKDVNVTGNWKAIFPGFGGKYASVNVTEDKPSNIHVQVQMNYYEVINKFGPGLYEHQVNQ